MGDMLFKLCRFCVRCFILRYQVCGAKDLTDPVIYIVHHQNLRGPITSMAWLNVPLCPWVLSVFCSRSECFRQYYNYTFTKRFGMPKVISAAISFSLSFYVSGLMSSMQAIPVFRDSKDIVKTFRQSILALASGRSLLICPDIDYSNADSSMGEMYKGFFNLDKYFVKQTGRHVAFVPLHVNKNKRCIFVGNSVCFEGKSDFANEKQEVYERLKQEFLYLEGKGM